MNFKPNIALILICAVAASSVVGCRKDDDEHGESTSFNGTINGQYWFVRFDRSVSTSISPDLQASVGIGTSDGLGTLTFGPNFGSPLPSTTRPYDINSSLQIDNTSDEPGSTLPDGTFFQLGDLDRMTGDDVGVGLFTKHATGMTVDALIDSGMLDGFYHATMIRFDRPGILTGIGNATITKSTATTASWAIDYTLSTMTTLRRDGALQLSPDGAVTANDVTTNRTYTGFAQENGDWVVWMETDTSTSQVFRMDILVRKATGASDASLNGRYNLVGFYQDVATQDVDTIFGRMQFDGLGNYSDFTTRDSFGNTSSTGGTAFPYSIASDGTITFVGGSNPIGFVTRNTSRRWFIFPDVDPNGTPASLGFFLATDR